MALFSWDKKDAQKLMGKNYFDEAEKLLNEGIITKTDSPERWKSVEEDFKIFRADNPMHRFDTEKGRLERFKDWASGKEGQFQKISELSPSQRAYQESLLKYLKDSDYLKNALGGLANMQPSPLENQLGESYQRMIPGLENMVNNPLESLGYRGSLYPGAIGQSRPQSLQDVLGGLTREAISQYGDQAVPYIGKGFEAI